MIYFIQAGTGGAIKIGFSKVDVSKRIKLLQTGSSVALRPLGEMDGTMKEEMALHIKFEKHRVFGEWFCECAEILAFIDVNCTEVVHVESRGKGGRQRLGENVRVVNVKVPESARDAWLLSAGAAGMDLSKWIRAVCDVAASCCVRERTSQRWAAWSGFRQSDTPHVVPKVAKTQEIAARLPAVLPRQKPIQTAEQRSVSVSAIKGFLADRQPETQEPACAGL